MNRRVAFWPLVVCMMCVIPLISVASAASAATMDSRSAVGSLAPMQQDTDMGMEDRAIDFLELSTSLPHEVVHRQRLAGARAHRRPDRKKPGEEGTAEQCMPSRERAGSLLPVAHFRLVHWSPVVRQFVACRPTFGTRRIASASVRPAPAAKRAPVPRTPRCTRRRRSTRAAAWRCACRRTAARRAASASRR